MKPHVQSVVKIDIAVKHEGKPIPARDRVVN